MPDPFDEDQQQAADVLADVLDFTRTYLHDSGKAFGPVDPADAVAALTDTVGDTGLGARRAIELLAQSAMAASTRASGGRFLDYVVGGSTPAAIAADWLVSVIDQNAAGPGTSAWATNLETLVLAQLVDLFGLPTSWSGVLTPSSMTATFTALSCATRWWGLQHGTDVTENGIAGLPRIRVFGSPLVHPTTIKAVQMLGHGRSSVTVCAQDARGRVDCDDLERRIAQAGEPAVIVATAGDASAGRFDPLAEIAQIADTYGCWLHVDGAFGLYVALSGKHRHRVGGLERANSIASDAHKLMNVPYESGFCLVAEAQILEPTFGMPSAPYLPTAAAGFRGYAVLGPESSRRARAAPIWASLAAYGRQGLIAVTERCLDAAAYLGNRIAQTREFDLVDEPESVVVCFTVANSAPEACEQLAALVTHRGNFAVGHTVVGGVPCVRVAIANWQTTRSVVDALVDELLIVEKSIRRESSPR